MRLSLGLGVQEWVQRAALLNQITASAYGFLPTASASDNVSAINAALAVGNVTVDVPGIYEVNASIVIPSNRKLVFTPGCSLKKMASYTYVIINKSATTSGMDSNIEIIGFGLNIIVNGFDSTVNTPVYGLRGHVSLFKVAKFKIDGISCSDLGVYQWFVHIAEVGNPTSKSYINNIDVTGEKDGIHFGVSQNIELNIINTTCHDDGIAFNAIDYPDCNPTFGDIKNITVNNWTDKFKAESLGYGCRILAGAWANWTTATSYKYGDNVTHDGNIYKKISADFQTSSVAPTHTTGSVTGADEITWIWSQAGTHTSANINNITLVNCKNESTRELVAITTDDSAYCRSIFPGTYANYKVDDIVLDNCGFDAGTTWIKSTGNVGKITVKNTNLTLRNSTNIFVPTQIDSLGSSVDELVFDNCNLNFGTTNALLIAWGFDATLPLVTMISTVVDSSVTNPATQLFRPKLVNQFTNIDLTDCVFNNIPTLLNAYITDCVVNINAVNTVFAGLGRIIWAQTYGTGTFIFNGVGCTYQTPTNFLFDHEVGSSIIVTANTSGSIGGPIALEKLANGVVGLTNCDLKP